MPTFDIPQAILDQLTDVPMPRISRARRPETPVPVAGADLPVLAAEAVVVGSGAAGLRTAVELKRRGVDVLVLSMSLFGGTSACSGSDKQTLHTCGTARKGDDFTKLAAALGAGGCMDHDTAYIEAVGSIHTVAGLQYLGLPLPTDRYGAALRYQTDHDDVGRATSCGPRTSRLMVKVLAEEAVRLGIPVLPTCEAVRLLTDGGRCAGVLAIERGRAARHGFVAVRAGSVVLATGGPGELFRDSVYPAHCYGSLGLALEAGAEACNLGECQFGIGTRRQDFPWNLSGTYVQAMPYLFSRGRDGVERNVLAGWYRTTRELASNLFRKGYQWPFHASRMLGFGSSLVDLAIHHESAQGRTVYLDFLRNPQPGADGRPFDLDDLDPDARAYLANNEALLPTPLERLRRMNPLAIELYRMHGHDLAREPLPFNVNHQHLNGGVAVDAWSESTVPGLFAVGEVAGTHGVTRPGGAALNAGQVAGLRAAEHIAHRRAGTPPATLPAACLAQAAEAVALADRACAGQGTLAIAAVRGEIQARMSDHAGFICPVAGVAPAFAAARDLRRRVLAEGFAVKRASQAVDVFRWRHLALTSEAMLATLDRYAAMGGGSRGARAWCTPDGTRVPDSVRGPQEPWRFRDEVPAHRQHKLAVRWTGDGFAVSERPLRQLDDLATIFFERNWGDYLTGAIHGG